MAVVDCCKYASDSMLSPKNGRPNLVYALETVHELLGATASALDGMIDKDRRRRQETSSDG
jgi:hypothetical protein